MEDKVDRSPPYEEAALERAVAGPNARPSDLEDDVLVDEDEEDEEEEELKEEELERGQGLRESRGWSARRRRTDLADVMDERREQHGQSRQASTSLDILHRSISDLSSLHHLVPDTANEVETARSTGEVRFVLSWDNRESSGSQELMRASGDAGSLGHDGEGLDDAHDVEQGITTAASGGTSLLALSGLSSSSTHLL